MMCPQFWSGHLYLHLPPAYIQIGFHCGLPAGNPSGPDTIVTSEGVTGHAVVVGCTEVEVSVKLDGCAGVVESSGAGGHTELEEYLQMLHPVKRKRV